MKTPRFFIKDFDMSAKEVVIENPEIVHQITKVLRLKEGQTLAVFDGSLHEAAAIISQVSKNSVKVSVVQVHENTNELAHPITLYAAVAKKDNFELIAQKATEIGVVEIVPLITERTVKMDVNLERLLKIVQEAAEQSGRGKLPTLHPPQKFEQSLEYSKKHSKNIFFDPTGVIRATSYQIQDSIGIWVGPEGGWSPKELEMAQKAAFEITSFGSLTYRAETAAIIACHIASKL